MTPSLIIHRRSLALTVVPSLATAWIGSQLGVRRALHRFPGPTAGAIRMTLNKALADPNLNLSAARRSSRSCFLPEVLER